MTDNDWHYFDYLEHPVFVLEADEDGVPRYTAINRFACQLAGFRAEDAIGKSALELFPGRLGQAAFDHHAHVFENGMASTYEILLPVGPSQRLLRTSLVPELQPDGDVCRVFGSSTDISGEHVVDNVQLGLASIKSEMEDFICLAAHDLRAPLRNVSSIAAMLREDFQDLGDGKLELIDLLEKVGSKAMSLIGDVLSFAQLSAPMPVQAIEFGLCDLVNEILTILDPWERCKIHCDEAIICGERMILQMILRNLIDNALKNGAAVDEQGALHLSVTVSEGAAGAYCVKVTDDGGGFDNVALSFLQGGKLNTGSGFGLLGVRRLVHARGGTITASALPGGVACVEIALRGNLVQPTPAQVTLR